MKGEESVDDVTEADRLASLGRGLFGKCLHARPPFSAVAERARGLALCAVVMRSLLLRRDR